MKLPHLITSLLFLAPPTLADGGFLAGQRLDSATANGPATSNNDQFGSALAVLGDLDGDGTQEVAIGAPFDSVGGSHNGVVHIVSLDGSGASTNNVAIQGVGPVLNHFSFGRSLANVGDLDGDGIPELAVGEFFDFWILFLDKFGNVTNAVENQGSALGVNSASFSFALAPAGDVNGDGVGDLIVSDPAWEEPGTNNIGAIWVVFLDKDGNATNVQKITKGVGIAGLNLDDGDNFGWSVANAGDVKGNGTDEIAVGTPGDDDGSGDAGAVYLLSLKSNGTVASHTKISNTSGDLNQTLPANEGFGWALGTLGDFDNAGAPDLVVGSEQYEGLWKLFLDPVGDVRTSIPYLEDDLPAVYSTADHFGSSFALLADANGNNYSEIVVGAPRHAGGGVERGAIYTLFPQGVTGASVEDLGCGVNPSNSLFVDDLPHIGQTVDFRLDTPFFNSINAGAAVFLIADLPDLNCGFLLPGAHLDHLAPAAELHVLPPFIYNQFAGFYEGPGQAQVEHSVPIPFSMSLLGLPLHFQGLFSDPSGGPSGTNFYGLTQGKLLTIGT